MTESRQAKAQSEGVDPSGCYVRLLWLAASVGVIVLGAALYRGGYGAASTVSLAYWGVVALAIGGRYVEIRKLHGSTLEGKPATLAHWRRFSVRMLAFSIALWAMAITLS